MLHWTNIVMAEILVADLNKEVISFLSAVFSAAFDVL